MGIYNTYPLIHSFKTEQLTKRPRTNLSRSGIKPSRRYVHLYDQTIISTLKSKTQGMIEVFGHTRNL